MKKLISAVLAAVLVFSCASVSYAATEKEAKIGVISDIHYIPRDYIGCVDGFNYRREVDNDRKLEQYSEELLDAAIDRVIADGDDYLFVSGDIALASHYDSHTAVAAKLKDVEARGIKVYVIPGNHDIVRADKKSYKYVADDLSDTIVEAGTTYVNDKKVEVRSTGKSEFASVYSDFGYGTDKSVIARADDSLSYVADLGDYRLIAVDANIYDGEYYTNKKQLDEARLTWVLTQIENATSDGDIPLVMMHYDLIEKYDMQSLITGANFLDGGAEIANAFADSGVRYVFTGHSHANDVASATTDNGNTVFEICTGGLLLHGSPVRKITLNNNDADISTYWIESIPGIADYQSFCDDYYYTDGIKIALRNRVIFDVADILTDTFCPNDSLYNEFNTEFKALMAGVCDRLLALETSNGLTVCDVLTEAYHQHYKGDEVYSDAMKSAVAEIKCGAVWTKALLIVEEELGSSTGLADILKKYSPSYNDNTLNEVAKLINTSLSPILGPLMGSYIENVFIDVAPADNNLTVVNGTASAVADSTSEQTGIAEKIALFFMNLVMFIKYVLSFSK